jgi:arsenate reductase-like glutaredoxin family protein
VHFVDLAVRAASPRELERFARAFGVEALIDRTSPRFAELGLGAASYSEERWLELLTREPRLLRLPLVRWGARLSIGRGTGSGERGKGKGKSKWENETGWVNDE